MGRFRVVADENLVDEANNKLLGPTARRWTDEEVTEPCGLAYYVVAVYQDFDGELQETDSSDTSWYDRNCEP
jgi:hypothetical protein